MAQAILTQLWPAVATALALLVALVCACGRRLLRCLCCASSTSKKTEDITETVGRDTHQEKFTTSDLWLRRSLSVGNGGRVLVNVSVDLNLLALSKTFLVEDTDPIVPLDDVWGLKDAQVLTILQSFGLFVRKEYLCMRLRRYV